MTSYLSLVFVNRIDKHGDGLQIELFQFQYRSLSLFLCRGAHGALPVGEEEGAEKTTPLRAHSGHPEANPDDQSPAAAHPSAQPYPNLTQLQAKGFL